MPLRPFLPSFMQYSSPHELPRPEPDSDSPPGIRGCRASLRIRIHSDPRHCVMLKALIEADPGALIRLLQLFQTRNIVPRSVRARRLGLEYIEAEIEFDDVEL